MLNLRGDGEVVDDEVLVVQAGRAVAIRLLGHPRASSDLELHKAVGHVGETAPMPIGTAFQGETLFRLPIPKGGIGACHDDAVARTIGRDCDIE